MNTTTQLRQIARRLRRSPLFTAITLITLAIGIGANTAIFSVIEGVLLKPLPYPHPEQLIGVWHTAPGVNITQLNMSPSMYFIYREQGQTFQDVGIWDNGSASVTGVAEPEQVPVLHVTDGILPILGIPPVIGRWFSRADDRPQGAETVMLTYGYWRGRFGGDPSVIGRRIVVDGTAREVIGVLPENFRFLDLKLSLVLPFRLNRNEVRLGNFSYQGIARLKPGVTLEQASADVARLLPISFQSFPAPEGFSMQMFEKARIAPRLQPLKQDLVGDIGNVLWVLMGTIGMVLLIACANVANLLLVRAEGRQQELAVRAALGAGWGQIARELLLESVALGVAGGVPGLGLAYAALRLLVTMRPANLPRLDEISIDPWVLLFALAISLVAGALFGLIPVFKYATPHVSSGLRSSGRNTSQSRERHRARSVLVVVQVGLALVLLISSGLMIRTFQALKHVQPGFTDPERIQTLRISIPNGQVREPDRVVRMQQDMLDKIVAIPGVSSVGFMSTIPLDSDGWHDPVYAEGHDYAQGELPPLRRYKFVSPGLFKTMGTPMVAGRELTWDDAYNKREVVVVSENMARELWHDPAAAIGKRIRQTPKTAWFEVVGVVSDGRDDGIDRKAPTIVYWPLLFKQDVDNLNVMRTVAFAVRSSQAGSEGLIKEIRQAIWSVNSNLPLSGVRTMADVYNKSLARTSFTLVMLALAGGMALLLGVVGIYGVISYSVSQRTREIGIRMALGARQEALTQMFLRHGLMLAAIGVVCGLGAAVALMRVMSALLFQVSFVDPLTYAAVSLGLVIAAAVASYLPARKATSVDPVNALRAE